MDMSSIPLSIGVFFAYSHRDEDLRDELDKHLSTLKRAGIISGWHDREITAGTEWSGQIDEHLNGAGVILLLVSSDFLASDYCYDVEMKRALERHEAGEARVIPVILRACEWKDGPLGNLLALPTDGRAVTSWSNQDEAFADVARGIKESVNELTQSDRPALAEDSAILAESPLTGKGESGFNADTAEPRRDKAVATGNTPEAVALLMKEFIRDENLIGFTDLISESVGLVLKEWQSLLPTLESGLMTPPEAVHSLDSKVASLTAAGDSLIYFEKSGWVNRLIEGVARIYNIPSVEIAQPGAHRLDFISVPAATVLIPYAQWIALALIRERADIAASLCGVNIIAPDGSSYRLLSDEDLINPQALKLDAMVAWKRVVDMPKRWEYHWQFFNDEETYDRAINEASFTMWLYAKVRNWESYETPYPYFLRNSTSAGHVTGLLSRLTTRPNFGNAYFKFVTSGTAVEFRNNWPRWADELNRFDPKHLRGRLPTELPLATVETSAQQQVGWYCDRCGGWNERGGGNRCIACGTQAEHPIFLEERSPEAQ